MVIVRARPVVRCCALLYICGMVNNIRHPIEPCHENHIYIYVYQNERRAKPNVIFLYAKKKHNNAEPSSVVIYSVLCVAVRGRIGALLLKHCKDNITCRGRCCIVPTSRYILLFKCVVCMLYGKIHYYKRKSTDKTLYTPARCSFKLNCL